MMDMEAPTGAAERERVQRHTLRVVVVSQILGGAGLAAGITVGALLAQDMLGSDRLSGLPTALFTLGSALAAFLIGLLTQRWGRRMGLGVGFAVGGLGAIGVVAAAAADSIPLLLAALFVYGAGSATNLQARYAGTDLAAPNRRGAAISVAMVATTLGAVAGPNLVEPMGALARALSIPELAGPFMLAAAAYLSAGVAFLILMRPDPFLLARRLDAQAAAAMPAGDPLDAATGRSVGTGVYVGGAVMVLTQVAMIAIMTMTPVHMREHHHSLGQVGLVIGIHIGAMYLPSLVTGALVDRVGRIPMAVASGVTLLAAGVVGAVSPGGSLWLLIASLALLGLGWNFGLIAGTALVVDATAPRDRPRVQGSIDVFIALAGAGGGAMSGLVMSGTSFAVLSVGSGLLAVLLVPVLLWARRDHPARPERAR